MFDLLQQFRDDNADSIEDASDIDGLVVEDLWKKHPHFMAEVSQNI